MDEKDLATMTASLFDGLLGLFRASAGGANEVRRELVALLEQGRQNVFGGELLVAGGDRGCLRFTEHGAGAVRELVHIHVVSPL